MENVTLRLEKEEDYRETENLVREAFWDVYKPGCNEHLVLHKLRNVTAFVPELDLVAQDDSKIVGQIVYSKAKVINGQNQEFIVLCMGPIAVLPSYQKKGIGTNLMEESINKAKKLGHKAIIIFGQPEYYHKFGFKNAKEYNIQTAQGENIDAFMALELGENSLNGIEGKFFYDSAFEPKEEELELFDKEFPY
jgi:predicted N-acetyltransferase YhbS